MIKLSHIIFALAGAGVAGFFLTNSTRNEPEPAAPSLPPISNQKSLPTLTVIASPTLPPTPAGPERINEAVTADVSTMSTAEHIAQVEADVEARRDLYLSAFTLEEREAIKRLQAQRGIFANIAEYDSIYAAY